MHVISKKDLSYAEMDILTKSCSPTIVITANGEVQTHEETTVYVKELDIFLTMKVLENAPAVLPVGKLWDENGYSYEWINGQKPHLILNRIRIPCNTENCVPIVVPGLSSSSSGSSSALRTPMKHLMAQVLSALHFHPWTSTWRTLFDSTSPLSTSSSFSCLSPSSSSTTSCSLSSSTKDCTGPRRTRVRTLLTSSAALHFLVRRSVESMLGSRWGDKRRFQEQWFVSSSPATFRTQLYWSFITGQCGYSEQLLPAYLPCWMCVQSSFYHQLRINTWRSKFEQEIDSILPACWSYGQKSQRSWDWFECTTSCTIPA